MLSCEGATLDYGSYRALDGISIHVDPGELVVMLGANGAGKSSLFLAISGLRKLKSGTIRLGDRDLVGDKPSAIVEAGLVQCPEGRKLFPGMSVEKNLRLGAYVHRRDPKRTDELLEEVFGMFSILRDKRGDPAGSLSGGQQQMVAIGRALMGRPKVLLLDEPSLGLSPLLVKEIFTIIRRVNEEQGMSILLVEQNAKVALETAHYGYVLEIGRIVMNDTCDRLMHSQDIQEFYLGAKEAGARGERRWKKKKTWR